MSLEAALLVVAALTLAVAGYAAVEARLARQSSQRGERESDHRWQASTRPRPRVAFADPAQMMALDPGPSVRVTASNPGGAITSGLVVARVREKLYIGALLLPAQSGQAVSELIRLPIECPPKFWTGNMVSEIVLVWAEDLEGRMWEARYGVVPDEPMPGDVGSEAFFAWLEKVRAQAQRTEHNRRQRTLWHRLVERVRRRQGTSS